MGLRTVATIMLMVALHACTPPGAEGRDATAAALADTLADAMAEDFREAADGRGVTQSIPGLSIEGLSANGGTVVELVSADHSARSKDAGITVYGFDVAALVEDDANGEPYCVRLAALSTGHSSGAALDDATAADGCRADRLDPRENFEEPGQLMQQVPYRARSRPRSLPDDPGQTALDHQRLWTSSAQPITSTRGTSVPASSSTVPDQ